MQTTTTPMDTSKAAIIADIFDAIAENKASMQARLSNLIALRLDTKLYVMAWDALRVFSYTSKGTTVPAWSTDAYFMMTKGEILNAVRAKITDGTGAEPRPRLLADVLREGIARQDELRAKLAAM